MKKVNTNKTQFQLKTNLKAGPRNGRGNNNDSDDGGRGRDPDIDIRN